MSCKNHFFCNDLLRKLIEKFIKSGYATLNFQARCLLPCMKAQINVLSEKTNDSLKLLHKFTTYTVSFIAAMFLYTYSDTAH